MTAPPMVSFFKKSLRLLISIDLLTLLRTRYKAYDEMITKVYFDIAFANEWIKS
jgi:hypothetical protein